MAQEFVTRRLIHNLATPEEVQAMTEQVLDEICSNAHNYSIFAKRWKDQMRPLLEFKKFLEDREKEIKLEKLNAQRNSTKKSGIGNSKGTAKDIPQKK
jgi:hypothetical protein